MTPFSDDSDEQDDSVDLTNLIDPMVLLCGLMMLLLPSMQLLQMHNINLANADGNSQTATDEQPTVVTFTSTGDLFLNEASVTREELSNRLGQLPQETEVLIAGDEKAEFGIGFELMSLVKASGHSCRGLTQKKRNE